MTKLLTKKAYRIFTPVLLLMLPTIVSGEPLRISYQYEQSSSGEYRYFFLIDRKFSYVEYRLESFYLQDTKNDQKKANIISGTLSKKDQINLANKLNKVGVLDWNYQYLPEATLNGKRVICHSAWDLTVAMKNRANKIYGRCAAPSGYKEFTTILRNLIEKMEINSVPAE